MLDLNKCSSPDRMQMKDLVSELHRVCAVAESEEQTEDDGSKMKRVFTRLAPHVGISVIVILYLLVGAELFVFIETKFRKAPDTNDTLLLKNNPCAMCLTKAMRSVDVGDMTPVFTCVERYCVSEVLQATGTDRRRPMSYTSGIMLAFTSITSIGYGTVVPVTMPGRLFCILYTMLGIPLALLAIADHGRFLATAITRVFQFCRWWLCRRSNKGSSFVDRRDDENTVPGFLIIILFNAYILVGGLLFSTLDRNWSFFDAVYFTFISSSTVGFGDLTPDDGLFLPLTLIYISFGLTLSTILVDLLALNLRKLHYWGARIRNCANTFIWFGGKRISVGQLMQAIAQYLKLPKESRDTLLQRLDHIVNNTIEKIEGAAFDDDIEELIDGPVSKCFDVDNDSITYIDASINLELET